VFKEGDEMNDKHIQQMKDENAYRCAYCGSVRVYSVGSGKNHDDLYCKSCGKSFTVHTALIRRIVKITPIPFINIIG